jgi:hypothetical protein
MKFEANIPSYLKTGQGVFPVQQKTMAAERQTTNLFEKLNKGADMPVANDGNMVALAPMGQDRVQSRPESENLLDKMQQNINRGIDEREFMPKSDVESDFKRVMPQIKPGVMREPTERMVQADGEDIFIG